MYCPNCLEKMNDDVIDGQMILHCQNCGGTFFQDNGINRISLASAQRLAYDKKMNEIFSHDKPCPKDQTMLIPIQAEESIPPNTVLLRCTTCQGVFAYPNDLVIFKKAQAVKIDYFKIWGIPLPSIRSVAVLSVFLFVSLISLATYTIWQKQNISNIQAYELIKNTYITSSNRYLFIYFKTVIPLKSRIIFTDLTANKISEKIIKGEPSSYHQLTTADINLDDEILYEIILTDAKGRETRTEVERLKLN